MSQHSTKDLQRQLISGKLEIVTPSKLKADVWKNFGFLKEMSGSPSASSSIISGFAACRRCRRVYAYDSRTTGTKTLINHSKSCSGPMAASVGQTTLEKLFGVGVPQSAKQSIVNAAAEFVCRDMRPFAAIEGEGMLTLATAFLQAGAKYGGVAAKDLIPSGNAVKNCVMDKATKIRAALGRVLSERADHKMIAFTTDLWTDDYKKISYMDLSAFYIDECFVLHQPTLSCAAFPDEKKTAENVRTALSAKLEEFGIVQSGARDMASFWFTTDCGSNIVAALKGGKTVQCMAHRLNTVLRGAWKETEAVNADALQFKVSCHQLVRFAKHGNLQQKLSTSLKTESATRWNSFYFTPKSIKNNYTKLNGALQGTRDFRLFASIDFHLLVSLTEFLKFFKQLTDLLETEKQPTLQNVVLAYHSIIDNCQPHENDENILALLKARILALLNEKVKLQTIHWVATFLDPSARKLLMLAEPDRPAKVVEIMAFIRDEFGADTGPFHDVGESTSIPSPVAKKTKTSIFEKFRSGGSASIDTSQLTLEREVQFYCDMDIDVDEYSSPLDLWRRNRQRLPRLSSAAAKTLVVPATSASSERTFSAAGRVYEERRTRLNPSTVDAILCVRSFLLDPVNLEVQ